MLGQARRLDGFFTYEEYFSKLPIFTTNFDFVFFKTLDFDYVNDIGYSIENFEPNLDFIYFGKETVTEEFMTIPFAPSVSDSCMEIINIG